MTRSLKITAGLCAFLFAVAAVRAEDVDNPTYLSWAKFKVGTTVTMTRQIGMAAMGLTMTQNSKQTLLELKPEKATVEDASTMDMGGGKQENKSKEDIAAKVDKDKQFLPANSKGTYKEVGKETLEIAGKKYDCTIYDISADMDQGKGTGKMWRCNDVPGGIVKMEMQMQMQMGGRGAAPDPNMPPMEASMKMTLVSFEAK